MQAVNLVPLPEGVPEVLLVTCNGRSGRLLVRSQRVQHGDSEISASKFEQVCGKGDAKKWKCSVWTEAEDGSQDMVSVPCVGLIHVEDADSIWQGAGHYKGDLLLALDVTRVICHLRCYI